MVDVHCFCLWLDIRVIKIFKKGLTINNGIRKGQGIKNTIRNVWIKRKKYLPTFAIKKLKRFLF